MNQKVILYGLTTCVHCKSLRNFLMDNNVDFELKYLDMLTGDERDLAVNELKKINPQYSFPTLSFGEMVIEGYKKKELRFLLPKFPQKMKSRVKR